MRKRSDCVRKSSRRISITAHRLRRGLRRASRVAVKLRQWVSTPSPALAPIYVRHASAGQPRFGVRPQPGCAPAHRLVDATRRPAHRRARSLRGLKTNEHIRRDIWPAPSCPSNGEDCQSFGLLPWAPCRSAGFALRSLVGAGKRALEDTWAADGGTWYLISSELLKTWFQPLFLLEKI